MTLRRAFLQQLAGILAFSTLASAQPGDEGAGSSWLGNYLRHWSARVETARGSQPLWITPLATSSARLGQELRCDYHHQSLANGDTLDALGAGKGLSLIIAPQTQVTLALPPYQRRRGAVAASGFADWPGMQVKYRMLSSTERAGNYVVSFINQYSLPTGSAVFTTRNHVLTSSLAAGKGWGNFSMQGTFGAAVPAHDHSRAGRAMLTNLVLQYHLTNYLWPEIEFNRTDWRCGARAGRSQTFLTTGVVIGRFSFAHDYRFTTGIGYQRAISPVAARPPATPAYAHNWIATIRTSF